MKRLASLTCMLPLVLAGCGGPSTAPMGATTAATASAHVPGPISDTWTRDRGTWHEHKIAGPPPGYLSSMTYDAAHHVFVLFGGWTTKGASDETWTFDGSTWSLQNPTHRPEARRGGAMAFDPVRSLVVLYGGLVANAAEGYASDDTWTWDGRDWTLKSIGGAPGHREGARMATTPDGVILYGGRTDNTYYFDDAWKFNGTNWIAFAKDGPDSPPARAGTAIAWDANDHALFLFGGIAADVAGGPGAQGIALKDTWLLTQKGWESARPGPPATSFSGAIWNPAAGRVEVLFGMVCPNPVADIWAWDRAGGWSKTVPNPVPMRWGAALAANPAGDVLVFGGDDERGC